MTTIPLRPRHKIGCVAVDFKIPANAARGPPHHASSGALQFPPITSALDGVTSNATRLGRAILPANRSVPLKLSLTGAKISSFLSNLPSARKLVSFRTTIYTNPVRPPTTPKHRSDSFSTRTCLGAVLLISLPLTSFLWEKIYFRRLNTKTCFSLGWTMVSKYVSSFLSVWPSGKAMSYSKMINPRTNFMTALAYQRPGHVKRP